MCVYTLNPRLFVEAWNITYIELEQFQKLIRIVFFAYLIEGNEIYTTIHLNNFYSK